MNFFFGRGGDIQMASLGIRIWACGGLKGFLDLVIGRGFDVSRSFETVKRSFCRKKGHE